VHRDVRNLAVSPGAARDVYGVVIDRGRLDEAATETRRWELRRERIGREPKPTGVGRAGRWVGDALVVQDGGETHCARCDEPLGSEGQVGARAHARVLESSLDPAGPHRGQDYGDLGFRLLRYVCPGCATQLHAELAYRGSRLVDPPDAVAEAVRYVRPTGESAA
jgi:N-methylhydantoinase B